MTLFRMVRWGGRPLLAFPDGAPDLALAAIGCYPAHTWKRRLLRVALEGAMRYGLRRVASTSIESPVSGCDGTALADWLTEVRARLGRSGLRPVFVWPADPRRGRIYAHLWDDGDGRVAFCKIALDGGNTMRLANERNMLEQLRVLKPVQSRIPMPVAAGKLMGNGWLALETVPSDARATCWLRDAAIDAQIQEIAGEPRIIDEDELVSLPWWPMVLRVCEMYPAFGVEVRRTAGRGVEVCRAHGDPNRTNVLRRRNEVWLLDWEQADESAPLLTDRAGVAADAAWQVARGNHARLHAGFRDSFPDHHHEPWRSRLALALAYLAAARFPPATTLISRWGC